MLGFLIVIVLLLLIGWLILLHSQIKAVETRLSARISKLEGTANSLGMDTEPRPAPVVEQPRVFTPAPISQVPPVPHPSRPAAATQTAARPRWSDKLRRHFGDREWETLVAGSLLNKIGALVLVIGVALFLGYSFGHINPAGRAATAAVIAIGILLSGIFLERKQTYRVFSRGLIGAGWAGLYVTAYAMYALPAAKIIANPFAGSILLLAVAAAMIAHSLRYRSQATTSVAYFAAFGALAATPSTAFAAASLIPLAASLLYLAWRMEWHGMALFGLFATYATCIAKGTSDAPLYAAESLLIIYWVLFEAFDLLRARRGARTQGLSWIFPLNALAFLELSYHLWFINAADQMWRMAALAAALFFASAISRLVFGPAQAAGRRADPFECIRAGTFEAPLIVAFVSAALAIVGRVSGFWTNIGLAAEAEIAYLAGVRFRSVFLRGLGMLGFAGSLIDIASTDWRAPGQISVLGWPVQSWTPSIFIHALLFYLNRGLRANFAFSFAASGLAALIIASETNDAAAPALLILFGFALFAIGMRKLLRDFRALSYLVALAGALLEVSHADFTPHPAFSTWIWCAACAAACWLFTAMVLVPRRPAIGRRELACVRDGFAAGGTAFALLTLWMLVTGELTALAWTALALLLIAAAPYLCAPSFRWIAAGVLICAYVLLPFTQDAVTAPLVVLAALYLMSFIFRSALQRAQRAVAPNFTWLAMFLALYLIPWHLHLIYTSAGWAALALGLLAAGLFTNLAEFRGQSYIVTAAAFFSCVLLNFRISDAASLIPRIAGASMTVAAFFIAEFLVAKRARPLGLSDRRARIFFAAVATLLLTGLLYHEVSGALLTIAWGIEALSCLAAGILLRDRTLPLAGLALLLVCILKLFVHDLRSLETAYRILSFIALGLILLLVSWIYTRFKAQIQRYL